MIRYDWLVLKILPVNIIIDCLNALTEKGRYSTYSRKVLEPISKFKDMSPFLLNPEGLILNRYRYTSTEIFIYLELASMRSYNEYKLTGSKKLPTYYIRNDYNLKKLNMNNLLTVTDEEIIFKYEEI